MSDGQRDRHEAMLAWIEAHLLENLSFCEQTTIDVVKEALIRYEFMEEEELQEITRDDMLDDLESAANNESIDISLKKRLVPFTHRTVERFQVLDKAESSGFYKNALLPKELLEEKNQRYVDAALFDDGKHSQEHLDFLCERQGPSNRNNTHGTALYHCIILSSGTGKTQLAATAALTYKKATTVYLLMGGGIGLQEFYKPHQSTASKNFKKALANFLMLMNGKGNRNEAITATIIQNWADNEDRGVSLFVRMLYHLLLQKPFRTPESLARCTVKFNDLKREIEAERRKFLVFLDEVPNINHKDFFLVTCLREALRCLGIAPILMSTHSGAQEYVGGPSRNTLSPWTFIISKLPLHRPPPQSKMLFPTERPLVLHLSEEEIEKGLSHAVKKVQLDLQTSKSLAWTMTPALQLVQLFGTYVKIDGKVFSNTHSLVGQHFGSLQQNTVAKAYNVTAAKLFAKNMSVARVSANVEPLLYLALVSWNETMLADESNICFPIVDSNRRALTVRGAFDACKQDFIPKIPSENLTASKLNGDMLEVLVHASLTLASMKTSIDDRGPFLPGMSLKHYIPLVRELMTAEHLEKLPPTPNLFNDVSFPWPIVPALGGAGSGLPKQVSEMDSSEVGSLVRSADGAMVDGQIFNIGNGRDGTPFLSLECKNYTEGVYAKVLKEVFKRIKPGILCSLIVVSKLDGNVFQNTKLRDLKEECFSTHHNADNVTVILWEARKEPCFLTPNGECFKAAEKTSLLVVVITVDAVDASIGRKRKLEATSCPNSDSFTVG